MTGGASNGGTLRAPFCMACAGRLSHTDHSNTMKTTSKVSRFLKRQWGMVAVGLALTAAPGALYADIHLDMLKTRTDVFVNVTVYSHSKTDFFIRHDRGIANIKIANLDPETITLLTTGNAPSKASASAKPATVTKENESPSAEAAATVAGLTSKLDAQLRQQMMSSLTALKALSAVPVNPTVVGLVLGVLFVAYLFVCYCLKLICLKTSNDPGILIWLPVFQMIPLLRAAGMSGWWFLSLFVPVVNLIVQIVWCFKIVQARGKSVFAAIGLLLPVTNLLSLLYLAFSDGNGAESSGNQRVSIAGAPCR